MADSPMTHPLAALIAGVPDYDAGLLNDYGGGNVDWWQDYLRAEIGRANEAWRENVLAALEAATPPDLVEAAGKLTPELRKLAWSFGGETADLIDALIALATAQAAQIAGLEAALVKINVGEGWAAQIARKALKEAGHEPA